MESNYVNLFTILNIDYIMRGITIISMSLIVNLITYVNHKPMCPICKKKFIEHSELRDKICKMITIKQFANNSPGFDVQFRPFFED
jgi:hypothetical protein